MVRSFTSRSGPVRFVLFALVLNCVSAAAETYYVSPLGHDGADGRSLQSAWRTLSAAAERVGPGDTVEVRGGVYEEQVLLTRSGKPGARITFKAYRGETPVIDGASIDYPSDRYTRRAMFEVRGAQHVLIEGLTARNASGLGLNGVGFLVQGPGASRVTLRRLTTRNTPSSGIAVWGGVSMPSYDGATHIVLEDNLVTHAMQGGFQEHITIAEGVERFTVRRNEVRDGGNPYPTNYPIGIDAKINVRKGRIHDNYIHHLPSSNGIYVDGWDAEASQIRIYANTVHDVDGAGITLGAEQGGTVRDIRIENNLVYRTGQDGLRVGGKIGNIETDPLTYDIDLINNTVHASRSSIWVEGLTGRVRVANNVFSGNAWNNGVYVYEDNQNYVTIEQNLIDAVIGRSWDDPAMVELIGTGAVLAAPGFRDPKADDYRLTAGSPAIDRGLRGPAPSKDHDGRRRPEGAGIDLGAFEFAEAAIGELKAGGRLKLTLPSGPGTSVSLTFEDLADASGANASIDVVAKNGSEKIGQVKLNLPEGPLVRENLTFAAPFDRIVLRDAEGDVTARVRAVN
jgi:hypothetical protein